MDACTYVWMIGEWGVAMRRIGLYCLRLQPIGLIYVFIKVSPCGNPALVRLTR